MNHPLVDFTSPQNQESWERDKVKKREEDMRKDLDGTSRKGQMKAKAPRESGEKSKSKERAPKKIKYSLMEDDWGERRSEPDPLKDGEEMKTPRRPWW